MTLGGIELDFWDILTFAGFFIVGAGSLGLAVLILGLPGRIAVARNHPDAEAVNLMGWVGFIAILPWAQALIWALKPSDVIDVRRWPDEVRRATAAMIHRMQGHPDAPPGPVATTGITPPPHGPGPGNMAPGD